MSPFTAPDPAPVEQLVPLAAVDPAPAASVRASLNAAVVGEYRDAVLAGDTFPAAELFAYHEPGGPVYLLGDGGQRLEGWRLAGWADVPGRVRWYGTRAEAEREAYRHAAGANEPHGLRRSNEDRRAAVRAVIGRPEYEAASDRELGRLCRVDHKTVRQVRDELSAAGKLAGGACSAARGYKPDTKIRGGFTADGKGGYVRSARTATTPADAGEFPSPHADTPQPEDTKAPVQRTAHAAARLTNSPTQAGVVARHPELTPVQVMKKQLTDVFGNLTRLMNRDDEVGKRLRQYLSATKLVRRRNMQIGDNGDPKGNFTGFRGLQRVLSLADLAEELSTEEVRRAYAAAEAGEDERPSFAR